MLEILRETVQTLLLCRLAQPSLGNDSTIVRKAVAAWGSELVAALTADLAAN
jgi:hypothetical protein